MSKKKREAKRSDNFKKGIILLIVIAVAVITIYYINDSENLIQESPLEDGDESIGGKMVVSCNPKLKDKKGEVQGEDSSFSIRFATSQAMKACKKEMEEVIPVQDKEKSDNDRECRLQNLLYCKFDSKLFEESCSIESCSKVNNGETCTYNSKCFNERGVLIPNCDKTCKKTPELADTNWNCIAKGKYDQTDYDCILLPYEEV